MIYLSVFIASVMLAYFATKLSSQKNKVAIQILSLLAILLPALLAGLRASDIGTDVEYYIINNFEVARHVSSFKNYLPLIYAKEPLYLAIVYIIAKVFGNIQVLLFTFSFLTILFVYLSVWKWKKNLSVPLFLLIYYFLYYNDSLNIIRQHLAMAIILYGITNLLEGKYRKYLIYIFIASLIHTAALVGIIFIICHWYVIGSKNRTKRKYKKIKEFMVLFAAGISVCGIRIWITLIVNIGLLDSRYLYYFEKASVSNNLTDTLLYFFEVIFLLCFSKQFNKYIEGYNYLEINAYLNLIVLQLARIMNYGHRLSLYFGIINLLLITQLPKITKNKKNRLLYSFFIVLIAGIYWIYIYCIGGMSHTFPYKFYFNAQ